MTTHNFHRSFGQDTVEYKDSRSAVFLRIHLCENKKTALYLEFYPFSPKFLCEQQEEERLKEADTYTASYRYWLRDVTYHNIDTYQNWQCLIENRISRHVWLKTYLKCRVVPKVAELKHTLMHKCTTFTAASRLFHRFLLSARSGSTHYHNALPNKTNSDCTS